MNNEEWKEGFMRLPGNSAGEELYMKALRTGFSPGGPGFSPQNRYAENGIAGF